MKKVVFFILLAAFFFGTMEVSLKVAGNGLNAFQTTFLRFIIGGLILLPFAVAEIKKNKIKLKIKDWLYILLLGTICVPASMTLFQLGIMASNASTAAVIFCVNPMFTVICAHFMTKDYRFTKGKIIAIITGIIGIVFMIRPWDIQAGNTVLGAAFLIVAAALFALYSVLGGKSLQRIGIFAQTSFSFIIGAIVLLIIILLTGNPVIEGVRENYLIIIYMSVVITGGGYLFYFLAIKHSNTTTGSIVFFLKPVIAPIIAVFVLSEVITWNMYIGIVLILVASFIIIREKKNGEKPGDDIILPE